MVVHDLVAWEVDPLGLARLQGDAEVLEDPATMCVARPDPQSPRPQPRASLATPSAPRRDSPPDAPPRGFNKGRRSQITSAPTEMPPTGWRPPVYSKSAEEKAALRTLLSEHVLLNDLAVGDIEVLIDAFQGLRFLPGARIITQGDIGETFYILESGACDISVEGQGVVMRALPGQSFGELALLYDCPRAATVVATERCKCWALEKVTFKRILRGNTMRRSARHEAFLDRVPVLAPLGRDEKRRLLDALCTRRVAAGEVVIREGTYGDDFYIIEEGEVRCTCDVSGGYEEICRRLVTADFFGERALLSTERRAATVTAVLDTTLLVLDRDTFLRLLGPLEECIQREAERQQRRPPSAGASPPVVAPDRQ